MYWATLNPYNLLIMAKFLKTTVVALGALLLSGSLAFAQQTPPPDNGTGKTPTATQTPKKGKKGTKKKGAGGGKKKGTKKPAPTTPPQ